MANKTKNQYVPDYLVTPGEILEEYLESYGMTQAELALRTGLAKKTVNEIIKGKAPLTHETALRLELVLGRPAHFWNNLEQNYQADKARLAEHERFQAVVQWISDMPVDTLIERGLVEKSDDPVQLLRSVLSFYGVSSVEAWKEIWDAPAVAARRSVCFETQPGAASAWIRQGELQAMDIDCLSYNRNRFKEALQLIRGLIVKKPVEFLPEMVRLCAESGVALAFVPEMKKVPWNGATKWLSSDKAMILLSLKGKREDIFWFSFFHEAGHVLNDNKKELYIADGSQEDEREVKADKFAAEILIPAKYNRAIEILTTKAQVRDAARWLEVSPGIVAGRYQHLTKKYNWFHDQIRGLKWAE